MSRIRYLKPDFFKDEDIATLPFEVRLFYQGLWNFADKAGRLEDRPLRLKAEIFPYDNVDINKCLELLSKCKNGSGKPFIQRYQIDNNKYIQILNWDKHQKPHHTEQASQIPPAPPLLYIKDIKDKDKDKGNGKGNGECSVSTTELSNVPTTVVSLCSIIINDLNEVLKSNYKIGSKTNISLIQAKLKDGFTVDDFKTVHRKMAQAWGLDNKMRQYLRPITLYGNKFESYLNRPEEIRELTTQQQSNLKQLSDFRKEAQNDKSSI